MNGQRFDAPSNGSDQLVRLYKEMLLIRRSEEVIAQKAIAGEISNLVHLSKGQEAVAVGVCAKLTQEDYVVSTHRCHAHYLAKGGDLNAMFAELYGKATGCSRGWGGSMHLVDPVVNMFGSSAIVGGSIPIAAGLAWASKLQKNSRVAVAFFGDGAIEQGVFWETLSIACLYKLPLIFVCENNSYATHAHISNRQPASSICTRVSSIIYEHGKDHGWAKCINGNDVREVYTTMKAMVHSARKGHGPSFMEASTYRLLEHWGPGEDWHLGYRRKEEGDHWKQLCPIANLRKYIISEFGQSISGDLQRAEESVEMRISEAVQFAGISPMPDQKDLDERFKEDTASDNVVLYSGSRLLKYREAVAEAYVQAMEEDERVVLMGEGVDGITGIYGTVLPAYAQFARDGRVIDTPLSENAMTGVVTGMAMAGLRPVLMHQRNDFMLLCMDQIINQAAMWKYFTGGRITVPVVFRAYIARKPGEGPQHTKALHALFGYFPGLKVVMPATPFDAKGMTLQAFQEHGPVVILEHRDLNEIETIVPKMWYRVPFGKARIEREGDDVTIVTCSGALIAVRKAADQLWAIQKVSCEVIDIRSIRPLDTDSILRSVEKTCHLVIVDVGWVQYGMSAEIAAVVAESYNRRMGAVPIVRVGTKPVGAPATAVLERMYHPQALDVFGAVIDCLEKLRVSIK